MGSLGITRRNFLEGATAASALAAFCPTRETQASEGNPGTRLGHVAGRSGSQDASRDGRTSTKILAIFPRTQGPPAFDPKRIAENVKG